MRRVFTLGFALLFVTIVSSTLQADDGYTITTPGQMPAEPLNQNTRE